MNSINDSLLKKKVWYFPRSDLYEGKPAEIHWASMISIGIGTKHQRYYFTRSVKEFFLCIMNPLEDVGYEGESLAARFGRLCTLTRWMVERGIWRFSSLTPENMIDFISSRKGRLPGTSATERSIKDWVQLFSQMWRFRDDFTAPLRFDPSLYEFEIWARAKPSANGTFKAIPEKDALALVSDALGWLGKEAPYIESILAELHKVATKVGVVMYHRTKRVNEFLRRIETESLFVSIRSRLGEDLKTYDVLGRAVAHTQGAVSILLFLAVGMRNRELCRLDIGCVQCEIGEDGAPEYYLTGVAGKQKGRHRKWAIFDPLRNAISQLEKLFAVTRRTARTDALFMHVHNLEVFQGKKGTRCTTQTMAKTIRKFANAPYRSNHPKIERLHPHACRKTFAQFVVKRNKRALEPLAWQFGHTYAAFTDGAYVGMDLQLTEMVKEADRSELESALEALLSAEELAGKGGLAFTEMKKNMIAQKQFRGKKGLRSLIQTLVAQNVVVAPCDWGFCVYSQSLSACAGSERSPNPILRAPDVCAGCANFSVTEEFKIWWSDRVKRDESFLKLSNLPEQTIEVVKRRLAGSYKVLRSFETTYIQEEN